MKRIFYLSLIFASIISGAKAQIPQTISYQGFYTDASGVPVNDGATQSHIVHFYFFKGEAADTSFSRIITNVKITKGLFGVAIGRNLTISDGSKNKPLPANIWHDPYKIQIGVDALPTGDKIPLTAVPYAMTAASVPAANLTGANTLPPTVLPTTVPIGNGATGNITLWTSAGTVGNDTDLSWNPGTNTLSATNFFGNGASLTSLAAANLTGTNTLPAAVLPTTVPLGNGVADNLALWTGTGTVGNDTDLNWNSSTNTLSATNFSGNFSGSGPTLSVPAANLTGTNTLPATALPTTVPIGNGATGNVTVWTGTGTVGNDTDLSWNTGTNTLSATNFSGNGSSLTSLTAANITGTNTLPAGVLPTTVPLGNGSTNNVTFWTGTGSVGSDADISWNSTTNILTATNFSGNGSALTSLTAANVTGTNTLPAGVLPTTVPTGNGAANRVTFWTGTGAVSSDADITWNSTTNILTATNFSGNGSALTSLTASNITGTNTLPAGVLPTTVPIGNGAATNITIWNGTGTVGNDTDLTWTAGTNTLNATNFSGNGASLSSLNASNLSTGTVADARLETNVDIAGALTTISGLHVGSNTAPAADNLEVDGYTKLGGTGVSVTVSSPVGATVSWPSIRVLKILGTCAAADGTATVTLAGLTESKILSIEVLVEFATGDYIHAGYTNTANLQFNYFYQNNILSIKNITGNSATLAGKPFKAIITYEE